MMLDHKVSEVSIQTGTCNNNEDIDNPNWAAANKNRHAGECYLQTTKTLDPPHNTCIQLPSRCPCLDGQSLNPSNFCSS